MTELQLYLTTKCQTEFANCKNIDDLTDAYHYNLNGLNFIREMRQISLPEYNENYGYLNHLYELNLERLGGRSWCLDIKSD